MTTVEDLDEAAALEVIEKLGDGIPPDRFVSSYSAGGEGFLKSVRKRHLESQSTRGKIRFISGNWGAGKTHFMRLLREEAFDAGYLVSTVELSSEETPFNKFEEVFSKIITSITSPEMYREGDLDRSAPFAEVLRRALLKAPEGQDESVSHEVFEEAKQALFAFQEIDIDFRRMVAHFWETYLPTEGDSAALNERRGAILQWFSGDGTVSFYRSQFGVQKIITRANARLMLESLCRFAVRIGYRGLLILLDEAMHAYSIMRKPSLRQAHNNLLHLINSIDASNGAILIYAATPDFFIDDRYGITLYGALAQRVGRPEARPPNALEKVWNLDELETTLDDYLTAAQRIREVFIRAYPDLRDDVPSEDDLLSNVAKLVEAHPQFSTVSTWRMVVKGTVKLLNASAGGTGTIPVEKLHADIMEELRES